MAKKAYHDRTDLQKLASQWVKISGLVEREEWSAAIVRAGTASELAANFAIRNEFAKFKLAPSVVDSLMLWANGLNGKMNNLIRPLWELDPAKEAKFKPALKLAAEINKKRNAVAHQGEFCNKGEVNEIIPKAEKFIEMVVNIYQPRFILKDQLSDEN